MHGRFRFQNNLLILNSTARPAVTPAGLANPDGIGLADEHGLLLIAEDTGAGHRNDAVWAYDLNSGALTRIASTPYGAEATSPYYYPDVNGFSYVFAVAQARPLPAFFIIAGAAVPRN